jgi:hypothetical protein
MLDISLFSHFYNVWYLSNGKIKIKMNMLHMLHVEWCVVGLINTLMKAIAKGACDYWIMPLDENQIKNM